MGGCVDVLRWAGASRFDAFDKLKLKRSPEPSPACARDLSKNLKCQVGS